MRNGAYGWLICCGLLAAVAQLRSAPPVIRVGAAAAALVGVTAVLVRPVLDAGPDVSAGVVAAAAISLAVLWALRQRDVWGQGARLAAALVALAATRMVVLSVTVALASACLQRGAPGR